MVTEEGAQPVNVEVKTQVSIDVLVKLFNDPHEFTDANISQLCNHVCLGREVIAPIITKSAGIIDLTVVSIVNDLMKRGKQKSEYHDLEADKKHVLVTKSWGSARATHHGKAIIQEWVKANPSATYPSLNVSIKECMVELVDMVLKSQPEDKKFQRASTPHYMEMVTFYQEFCRDLSAKLARAQTKLVEHEATDIKLLKASVETEFGLLMDTLKDALAVTPESAKSNYLKLWKITEAPPPPPPKPDKWSLYHLPASGVNNCAYNGLLVLKSEVEKKDRFNPLAFSAQSEVVTMRKLMESTISESSDTYFNVVPNYRAECVESCQPGNEAIEGVIHMAGKLLECRIGLAYKHSDTTIWIGDDDATRAVMLTWETGATVNHFDLMQLVKSDGSVSSVFDCGSDRVPVVPDGLLEAIHYVRVGYRVKAHQLKKKKLHQQKVLETNKNLITIDEGEEPPPQLCRRFLRKCCPNQASACKYSHVLPTATDELLDALAAANAFTGTSDPTKKAKSFKDKVAAQGAGSGSNGKKKSKQSKPKQKKKSKLLCNYYKSNTYCKYGDNCKFSHGESGSSPPQLPPPQPNTSPQQQTQWNPSAGDPPAWAKQLMTQVNYLQQKQQQWQQGPKQWTNNSNGWNNAGWNNGNGGWNNNNGGSPNCWHNGPPQQLYSGC